MAKPRVDRAVRHGAAYALFGAFHMMHAVASVLDNIKREMYKGLTEQERRFVKQRANHFRDEAEVLRKLAWRLLGKDNRGR